MMLKNRRKLNVKEEMHSPPFNFFAKASTSDMINHRSCNNFPRREPEDVVDSGIQESSRHTFDVPNDFTPGASTSGMSYYLTEKNLRMFNALHEQRSCPGNNNLLSSKFSCRRDNSDDYDQQFQNLLSVCSDFSQSDVFNDIEKEFLAVSVYQALRKIIKNNLLPSRNSFYKENITNKSFAIKSWLQKHYEMGLLRDNVMKDLFKMDAFQLEESGTLPEFLCNKEIWQRSSSTVPNRNCFYKQACNNNLQDDPVSYTNSGLELDEGIRSASIIDREEIVLDSETSDEYISGDASYNMPRDFHRPSACSSILGGTPHYWGKSFFSPGFQSGSTLSSVQPVSSSNEESKKKITKKKDKHKQLLFDVQGKGKKCLNKVSTLKNSKSKFPKKDLNSKCTSISKNKKRKYGEIQLQTDVSDSFPNTSSYGRNLKRPSTYWSSKTIMKM